MEELPTGKLRTSIKLPGNPWMLALSDDERYLAASDQNSGLHIIDMATGKTLLTKSGATMLAALDINGEQLAAASWSTTGTTGVVELTELPGIAAPRQVNTGMAYLVWLRLSADGSRLAVADYTAFEYYEIATGKLLTRIEFQGSGADADFGLLSSFSGAMPGQHLALSPDGNTLASFSGGQITLRDLPSGKSRLKITGGWRSLQILIFTRLRRLGRGLGHCLPSRAPPPRHSAALRLHRFPSAASQPAGQPAVAVSEAALVRGGMDHRCRSYGHRDAFAGMVLVNLGSRRVWDPRRHQHGGRRDCVGDRLCVAHASIQRTAFPHAGTTSADRPRSGAPACEWPIHCSFLRPIEH
jgi:hypothetical protein